MGESRPAPAAPLVTHGPFTVSQVAVILGVHVDTVRDWCSRGQLGCDRTAGGHRRITGAHLDAFAARCRARAA